MNLILLCLIISSVLGCWASWLPKDLLKRGSAFDGPYSALGPYSPFGAPIGFSTPLFPAPAFASPFPFLPPPTPFLPAYPFHPPPPGPYPFAPIQQPPTPVPNSALPPPTPVVVPAQTAAALSVASLLHALIAKKFYPPIIPFPVPNAFPYPLPVKVPVPLPINGVPFLPTFQRHQPTQQSTDFNFHRQPESYFGDHKFETNSGNWRPLNKIVQHKPHGTVTILKPVDYREDNLPADAFDNRQLWPEKQSY